MNTNYRVPKTLLALVIIILGAMYYYAAYLDIPTPEDTVTEFYEAYFNEDYTLAAENISVFWAAQLVTKYADSKPSELLADRAALEKEAAEFFAMVEEQNPAPSDVAIEVDSTYTKTGEYSALVVYELTQEGKPISLEMAMLIKENNRFYIINIFAIEEDNLKDIQEYDIDALDSDFKTYLQP